jgi:hypothetical protein
MPKRFTATEIWDEDWFLEMPLNYQLFWFYVKDKCDHAGMFKQNVIKFNAIHKTEIDLELAFEYFNKGKKRLRKINGSVWLIEEFFSFQYGHTLNTKNTVHKSIKDIYEKNEVELRSVRGLREVKEGVKDKDKDKDKDGF